MLELFERILEITFVSVVEQFALIQAHLDLFAEKQDLKENFSFFSS